MTNGLANGLWKKALATLVLGFTTSILVNLADPQSAVWMWQWWRHVLIAALAVTIVYEAKFWNNWAKKTLDGDTNGGQGTKV